jgi:methyl-accepting chemotaxis protein
MVDPAGGHAGTLDVGMDFNPILDGLKATYQMELALFIAEELLRKFATGLSGEILAEQNRRGKYVKFHSTHWALMQDLATESDVINVGEKGLTRKLRGITYGVVMLPIKFGLPGNGSDHGCEESRHRRRFALRQGRARHPGI